MDTPHPNAFGAAPFWTSQTAGCHHRPPCRCPRAHGKGKSPTTSQYCASRSPAPQTSPADTNSRYSAWLRWPERVVPLVVLVWRRVVLVHGLRVDLVLLGNRPLEVQLVGVTNEAQQLADQDMIDCRRRRSCIFCLGKLYSETACVIKRIGSQITTLGNRQQNTIAMFGIEIAGLQLKCAPCECDGTEAMTVPQRCFRKEKRNDGKAKNCFAMPCL